MGKDKTQEKIFLDPEVILKPINFALHLALFSELEFPILIPLGWLWEELTRKYSVITLADILNWHTGDIDQNMDQPIWSETLYPIHATSALLSASKKLGLIECVATERYSNFFRSEEFGNWSTYMTDLIDNEWTEIPSSKEMRDQSKNLSINIISKRLKWDNEKVSKVYEENFDWAKRTEEGYKVFEEVRYIDGCISQLYSCLELNSYFASSNDYWRSLVHNDLLRNCDLKLPMKNSTLTPFLRILKMFPKNFTVGDILRMIEAREILNKFGEFEELIESIEESKNQKELAKSSLLYLIGIIPGAGNIASALGAADFIKQASELMNKKEPLDSLLYSEVSEWALPDIPKKIGPNKANSAVAKSRAAD